MSAFVPKRTCVSSYCGADQINAVAALWPNRLSPRPDDPYRAWQHDPVDRPDCGKRLPAPTALPVVALRMRPSWPALPVRNETQSSPQRSKMTVYLSVSWLFMPTYLIEKSHLLAECGCSRAPHAVHRLERFPGGWRMAPNCRCARRGLGLGRGIAEFGRLFRRHVSGREIPFPGNRDCRGQRLVRL